MAPVWQYGAFGGVGASFFAAKTPKSRQEAAVILSEVSLKTR